MRSIGGVLVFALSLALAVSCDDDDGVRGVDNGAPGAPSGDGVPTADALALGVEEVVAGVTSPLSMIALPGSGAFLLVDQIGLVHFVDAGGKLGPTPFLDLRDRLVELDPAYDERGLLGLAVAPDFQTSGALYVYFTAPLRPGAPAGFDHTGEVGRFVVAGAGATSVDPDSYEMILQIDHPQPNHNGGTLAFGPDGYLYISIGDGGGANDVGLGHAPEGNAQDLDTLLGKILRIDVGRGEPYSVPADNPFVGRAGRDEIWAYGLRNPYRFSFWTDAGGAPIDGELRLIVADAGQNRWEEVNVVRSGDNLGWPIREARHCFDRQSPDVEPADCEKQGGLGEPLVDPVLEYQNANVEGGLGHAAVGGFVYYGEAIPELAGYYVFGDFSAGLEGPQGRLFVARASADEAWTLERPRIGDGATEHLGVFVLGFAQGEDGELYVLSRDVLGPTGATGRAWRLISAAASADDGTLPEPAPSPTPPTTPSPY